MQRAPRPLSAVLLRLFSWLGRHMPDPAAAKVPAPFCNSVMCKMAPSDLRNALLPLACGPSGGPGIHAFTSVCYRPGRASPFSRHFLLITPDLQIILLSISEPSAITVLFDVPTVLIRSAEPVRPAAVFF